MSKILDLASAITIAHIGKYDDSTDGEVWMEYRNGVLVGMTQMLMLLSPLLNEARNQVSRPQKPDKLKNEIMKFEQILGLEPELNVKETK